MFGSYLSDSCRDGNVDVREMCKILNEYPTEVIVIILCLIESLPDRSVRLISSLILQQGKVW